MVDFTRLWRNEGSSRLLYIVSGRTQEYQENLPDLESIAAHFWQHGFSCYIDETALQEGHPDHYSMNRFLCEIREKVDQLKENLNPSGIVFLGLYNGGILATFLASEIKETQALILWNTPPRISSRSKERFFSQAFSFNLTFAPAVFSEYLEAMDASPKVACPVLVFSNTPPDDRTQTSLQEFVKSFSKSQDIYPFQIAEENHSYWIPLADHFLKEVRI